MALPRLVRAFQEQGCFTLAEATHVTGSDRAATRKEIEYLRGEDYIRTVRKGLYALDPETVDVDADPYVLASKVVQPYVLGYHSALELHGIAQSAYHDTVYIASPRPFQPFQDDGIHYRHVAQDLDRLEFAITETKRSGLNLRVAGRELTVVQCADRPKYAGGFEEVVKSLSGFPYLQWEPLLEILDVYDKTVLFRKVGYLISQHADRWDPPAEVLDELRSRLGKGTTYFGIEPNQGGRLVNQWQVIVPPSWGEAGRG